MTGSDDRGSEAHDPTGRFGDRVEHYARHRPGYPAAALDLIEREAGLAPGDAVADIGSGTGILSAQLLDRGWEVRAVEPNRAMRAEAERRLAGRPGFHSVAGRAEATGLAAGSVDCVTAAQAFHWFDREAAREEFRRILRPLARRREGGEGPGAEASGAGGERGDRVFLLWNTRRTDGTAFLREFEELLRTHGTDYQAVRHDRIRDQEIRRFFAGATAAPTVAAGDGADTDPAGGRDAGPEIGLDDGAETGPDDGTDTGPDPGACRRAVFPNEQVLDRDGLRGRVLSMSYVPAEGDPARGPMLEALDRLFARHAREGHVRLEYDTEVWYGRLRSAP